MREHIEQDINAHPLRTDDRINLLDQLVVDALAIFVGDHGWALDAASRERPQASSASACAIFARDSLRKRATL